jgi:ferrous iron transport protein A
MKVISLADLPVGARAVLEAPTSVDATVVRLHEMGMTPGTIVTLTRRAPWGDPIEIALRGTRLCLRKADAARFGVARLVTG